MRAVWIDARRNSSRGSGRTRVSLARVGTSQSRMRVRRLEISRPTATGRRCLPALDLLELREQLARVAVPAVAVLAPVVAEDGLDLHVVLREEGRGASITIRP